MSIVNKTFFHATPGRLMVSLLIDTILLIILRPSTPGMAMAYVICFPGFDLLCAVISYWNYVQDYRKAKRG